MGYLLVRINLFSANGLTYFSKICSSFFEMSSIVTFHPYFNEIWICFIKGVIGKNFNGEKSISGNTYPENK